MYSEMVNFEVTEANTYFMIPWMNSNENMNNYINK